MPSLGPQKSSIACGRSAGQRPNPNSKKPHVRGLYDAVTQPPQSPGLNCMEHVRKVLKGQGGRTLCAEGERNGSAEAVPRERL